MKLNQWQHMIYDLVISTLAVIAVILVLVDYNTGLSKWQQYVNNGILLIFTLDYVIRLWVAPKKKKFILHNLCDLIAILPFYQVFRAFKLVHFSRVFRVAKLPRMFAFLYRPLKKAEKFFDTNGFKYVVFITTILILIGGVLIHFAENMSISDGIWWAFVTATTVGYGDISPSSFYGRMIAMVLMLMGIGLIGSVTSTLTSFFLNQKEKNVKEKTIGMIQEQLDNFEELSEEDIDNIYRILKALKKKQN